MSLFFEEKKAKPTPGKPWELLFCTNGSISFNLPGLGLGIVIYLFIMQTLLSRSEVIQMSIRHNFLHQRPYIPVGLQEVCKYNTRQNIPLKL